MIVECIALAISSILIWEVFVNKDVPPLHGVYTQPGRWFIWKRLFAYFSTWHWKRFQKKNLPRSHPTGYGPETERTWQMERPQDLPTSLDVDMMSFFGVDHKGSHILLMISRRPGSRTCDIRLTVDVAGVGSFQHPQHPDCVVPNTDGSDFSAAGLRFECLEPMRRWKITYNGILRKGTSNTKASIEDENCFHIKFAFIWEAFTDYHKFDVDYDAWLLSEAIAREKWTGEFWEYTKKYAATHYDQWGEMRGTFTVDDQQETGLSFRGARAHVYGPCDNKGLRRYAVHTGHMENGAVFNVGAYSNTNGITEIQTGYMSLPCGFVYPLEWTDLHLGSLAELDEAPQKYTINLRAGGVNYTLEILRESETTCYLGDEWEGVITNRYCTFSCNGRSGHGFTSFYAKHSGKCPLIRQPYIPRLKEVDVHGKAASSKVALVLPFEAAACTSSDLVGGKGCQLALLTQMKSKEWIVPSGFCLTIEAFDNQLQGNPVIQESISSIHKISSGQLEGDLDEACKAMVDHFLSTEICDGVGAAVDEQLKKQFTDMETRRFAVRSSALGEDGSDMSAAGQMDTVLGVQGIMQINAAIKKCWASHFAFTAVEYRRQHGQHVTSKMGIVIQEMVSSQVSGVLFTQDPLTSNPAKMTINANFGLGESVVAGSSEPDSITIAKSIDGKLHICEKVSGGKQTYITMTEGGGTQEISTTEEKQNTCCLSEESILKLAKSGLDLEMSFGEPRDIEWAIQDDTLYLLQARPITTLFMESDWEILHEFDTPLACDQEILTSANIGEMMPGAMTPLTISTFFRGVDVAQQDMMIHTGVDKRSNLSKSLGLASNHGFINFHYLYGMCENRVLGNDKRMCDLAILGEVMEDVTLEQIETHWGKASFLNKLISCLRMRYDSYDSHRRTQEWQARLKDYDLCHHSSCAGLYKEISEKMPDYLQCWSDTVVNSGRSAVWSSVLMATITKGAYEWNVDHYSDVALLLSKCEGVYSADVPQSLQELAGLIRETGEASNFGELTPKEAVSWLNNSTNKTLHQKYLSFLNAHGHRCIREAEFRETSWQTEPAKFVSAIQALLKGPASISSTQGGVENVDTAISQLKSSLTYVGKKVLQWAVPKARQAVGGREWGKSISIEMVEKFKLAYWKLSKLMKEEGYIPDEDLLFFFTHLEIGSILSTRSSRLVAKAQKRRRLHGKLMETNFPRLNKGHPQPLEDDIDEEDGIEISLKLTGTPVSQGKAKGTARIVTKLEDAGNIEAGDVLVVNYTDVGWSPYFPLISGLVTEMGGLLSHGAVVAREYGIPCVVNVPRATKLVKSGNTVILDGKHGILQRVA